MTASASIDECLNIGVVSPVSLERNSLKQLLLEIGHKVYIFKSSADINADNGSVIDMLLVSDLVLIPEKESSLTETFNTSDLYTKIPVVVITDLTTPDLENIVRKFRADDFISRPLNRFTLDTRVKLVRHRLRLQAEDKLQIHKEQFWQETIHKASELVNHTQKLENSFAVIAHRLKQIIPIDQFVISLNEESGVHYDVIQLDGDRDKQAHFSVQLCHGVACMDRQICGQGFSKICSSVKDQDVRLAEGMKSCICLGLYEGGRRLGALSLASRQENAFDKTQLPYLESLALQVANTVANIQGYQRIVSEAKRLSNIVREVHHRIKNNLQGIIGLLSRYREDQPELGPILDVINNQLYTVAEVHNLLSRHDRETVDWHALIKGICEVNRSLSSHHLELVLTEATADLRILASEAVPMALSLNELLQNAISHGYPDGGTGTIRVYADMLSSGQEMCLTISDDGIPPPRLSADVPDEKSGTGLNLVRSLLPDGARFRLYRQHQWTLAETIYPAYSILGDRKYKESA